MKNRCMIALLTILVSITACNLSNPAADRKIPRQSPDPQVPGTLNYSFDDTTIFGEDLQADEHGLKAANPLVDIYHIEVSLADDLLSLSGSMKVRYFNRLDGTLDEVYFRLLPNLWGDLMQADQVNVNGIQVSPILENNDTALYVPLPEKVSSGGQVDIELQFRAILPQDGSGNYGTYGFQDGTLALAQFYPLIPLRDEKGWRIEVYPPDGDVTVTESANYLVRISAPAELTLACSGVQIDREIDGDHQTILQVAALSREFYLAANAEYKKQSAKEDGVTFAVYSQSDAARTAKESLDYMTSAASIFGQRFGIYPFNELDLAATPTSAGGVEYPGVIAINQDLFIPGGMWGSMRAEDVVEAVVVHEVAHEWFYNIVGNDQGREPWLDEAMAQYLTYIYFNERYGSIAAESYMDSWWARWYRVEQKPIPIGMPVEAYDSMEYGAIVYGRGPIFLYELSIDMGQDAFNKFLKNYFETYAWKVASGQDFQSLAEATCNCDLDPIFNTWVNFE